MKRRLRSSTPFVGTSKGEGSPRVFDLCSPLEPRGEGESFLGVSKVALFTPGLWKEVARVTQILPILGNRSPLAQLLADSVQVKWNAWG